MISEKHIGNAEVFLYDSSFNNCPNTFDSSIEKYNLFWCFFDRALYYRLILFTNFNAQFLNSLTICMLHYNPRQFSSINMPVFRRTNCIITASGIVTLYSRVQYAGWEQTALQSTPIRHTVQPFTESDNTSCCVNTVCPPEDGHVDARNLSRIVM